MTCTGPPRVPNLMVLPTPQQPSLHTQASPSVDLVFQEPPLFGSPKLWNFSLLDGTVAISKASWVEELQGRSLKIRGRILLLTQRRFLCTHGREVARLLLSLLTSTPRSRLRSWALWEWWNVHSMAYGSQFFWVSPQKLQQRSTEVRPMLAPGQAVDSDACCFSSLSWKQEMPGYSLLGATPMSLPALGSSGPPFKGKGWVL